MARNKQNANIRVHFRTGILLRLTKIWSAKRKCNRHVYVWSPNSQRTNRTELLHYARISQHTHEFRAQGRVLPTMQNFIYTNVGQALACVSSLFLSNYTIQSEKEKKRTEYWSRSQPGMPISCFINTLQRIPEVSRPESINTHALLVGMTRLRRPMCSCAPACTPSEPSRSPSTCTRSNISKSNCPY